MSTESVMLSNVIDIQQIFIEWMKQHEADCSMFHVRLLLFLLEIFFAVFSYTTYRETWIRSLGWEDLLEKEMATHSSNLAWEIPWTEDSGRLQSIGLQRVAHDWAALLLTLQLFGPIRTQFQDTDSLLT